MHGFYMESLAEVSFAADEVAVLWLEEDEASAWQTNHLLLFLGGC